MNVQSLYNARKGCGCIVESKLLLFDLDGTLLTSKHVVAPTTEKAIIACKLKGLHIGFITARAHSPKNKKLIADLPCDYIAYYNGAEIYYGNNLLESNKIPYEQAIKIILQLHGDLPNAEISVYMEPWSYSTTSGEVWHIETQEKRKCNILNLPQFDVQRIRLFSETINEIPLQDYMTKETTFFVSIFGDAIIIHKNANKKHALMKASEVFDISPAQVVAFSDDINDVEMIKVAGTGVAMGNAVAELKNVSDFITESNDNDGIANWINRHLLVMKG